MSLILSSSEIIVSVLETPSTSSIMKIISLAWWVSLARTLQNTLNFPVVMWATVINGISFKATSGDFIGVMGHTGAGKSTILKLIERFYEPQSGEILINGININDFSIKSVRERIGFVSQ